MKFKKEKLLFLELVVPFLSIILEIQNKTKKKIKIINIKFDFMFIMNLF